MSHAQGDTGRAGRGQEGPVGATTPTSYGQGNPVDHAGRTWQLWAHRFESGALWHIGTRRWVELHRLSRPLVPVLVEEVLGNPYAPEVTHYGWQYPEGSLSRHGDVPTMIQVRSGSDQRDPKRAMMLLNMCFPYGLHAAIERGEGRIVALRITERQELEVVP